MVNRFAVKSKAPRLRRFHVIRDGQEVFVLEIGLTLPEQAELAERAVSPLARRRFGARLRAARRAENRVLWAQLAATEAAR